MALSLERKVGFFFVVGLIILGALLEVGEKWNPFEKKIPYKTYLSSITGLKIGDPVRLAGVDVGKIKKILLHEEQIEIQFEVEPGTKIKTDSTASLRLTNLLGGQFLGISFGSKDAPLLPPGGTVRGRDLANMDQIIDNMGELTKEAKSFIAELNTNQNQVMGKINSMLDENRGNIREAIGNINNITAKFDRGDGSLAMLLNDRALYRNANETAASLKVIAGKIERGEGTVGRLINDDSLYLNADKTLISVNESMKDVREIAAKINRGEGTIGKLIHDDSLYTQLRDSSKNIKDITQKINDGQGTIGKLVNEDKLYYDASATLKKAEKAAEGLGDSGPISVLGTFIGTLF